MLASMKVVCFVVALASGNTLWGVEQSDREQSEHSKEEAGPEGVARTEGHPLWQWPAEASPSSASTNSTEGSLENVSLNNVFPPGSHFRVTRCYPPKKKNTLLIYDDQD